MLELKCFRFDVMRPPALFVKTWIAFRPPPSPILKTQQCQRAGNHGEAITDATWVSSPRSRTGRSLHMSQSWTHNVWSWKPHTGVGQAPDTRASEWCWLWALTKPQRCLAICRVSWCPQSLVGQEEETERTLWALQQVYGGRDAQYPEGEQSQWSVIVRTDESSSVLQSLRAGWAGATGYLSEQGWGNRGWSLRKPTRAR